MACGKPTTEQLSVKALQEQKLEWIVRISDETCGIVISKDPLVKITSKLWQNYEQ